MIECEMDSIYELLKRRLVENLDPGRGGVDDQDFVMHFYPKVPCDIALLDTSAERLFTEGPSAGKELFQKRDLVFRAYSKGRYINVDINTRTLCRELIPYVLEKAQNFGFSNIGKGDTLVIEHTSLTPAYPINLSTFRGAIIGDAISNLYRKSGFEVTTHYWVDDYCQQLNLIEYIIKKYSISIEKIKAGLSKEDHSIASLFAYSLFEIRGRELDDTCLQEIVKMFPFSSVLRHLDFLVMSSDIPATRQQVVSACMKGIQETMKRSNINIDKFIYSSEVNSMLSKYDGIDRLKLLINNLRNDQIDSNIPNYLGRNISYYIYGLKEAKRVISVVSIRQRDVINIALDIIKAVNGAISENLMIRFFGDMSIGASGFDSISKGIFNSVDKFVSNEVGRTGLDEEYVYNVLRWYFLKSKPHRLIRFPANFNTIYQEMPNFAHLNFLIKKFQADEIKTLGGGYDELPEFDQAINVILKELIIFPKLIEGAFKEHSFSKVEKGIGRLVSNTIKYMENNDPVFPDLIKVVMLVLDNSLNLLGINSSVLSKVRKWKK